VRQTEGIAHLVIIAAVILVVVVLAVAVYVLAFSDDLGERADSDDIAIVEAYGSVDMGYAFGAYWGTAKLTVSVEYDTGSDGGGLHLPEFSIFSTKHTLVCEMRCTGPGDYAETTHQTKKFEGMVASVEYDFDTMRFPVETAGNYKVTMKVTLDGKDFCSGSETVQVNAKA
jgi:hypothetical protein